MKKILGDTLPFALGSLAFGLLCKPALASHVGLGYKILLIADFGACVAGLILGLYLIVDQVVDNRRKDK